MATNIKLTFVSQPGDGTEVVIVDSYTGISYAITFNNPAISPIPIGTSNVGSDLIQSANNYQNAFNLKWNTSLLYTLSLAIFPDVYVQITANNPNSQFSVSSNTTAGAITTSLENEAPPSPAINITDVTISEAVSNPCTTFDLDVTTDILGDNILSPVSEPISGNPHSLTSISRANEIQVTIEKIGSELLAKDKIRVPLLLTSYFDLNIVNTPSGASLTVVKLFPWTIGGSVYRLLPTLEYSLDDSIWQTSNSWSGLPDGAGTMYIRDNIGCKISIAYTIDAFQPNLIDYDPIIEISKVNPFHFKLNEAWSNCGVKKNITNTLSYEENVDLNRKDFIQLFQTCDIIKTQIKSNYETNTAKLVDSNGVETPLTVVATTSNMNITDVRDGTTKKNPTTGQLGVCFGVGNIYDPITLLDTGVDYNLGQEIMSWINIGDYINIEGAGWCYISSIQQPIDSSELTIIWTTTDHGDVFSLNQVVKITSIYNVVDYDRYEFEVDMSGLLGYYYLVINAIDSNFTDKEYVSEWFDVKVEQKRKHHLIEYYNSKNNEINYSTGITFKLRVPYIKQLEWSPLDEQEIYITDTKTVLLETRLRESYTISFMPLPTAMAQKIILILSHDRIQIDGLNYVREGEPDISQMGNTNLYIIKSKIVRSDYTFNNTGGTTIGEILLGSGVPLSIDSSQDGLLWVE